MERNHILKYDLDRVETPCFIVDTELLAKNLEILAGVKREAGCKILLAQKAFSMYSVYPQIAAVLDGTCASSPHEARLGREEFGKELHVFAAAYSERDMDEIVQLADHIVFNSFAQYERFKDKVAASGRDIECALRVNPRHSEGAKPIYDPCAPGSRLGITLDNFKGHDLSGITGLHFHTLCEQNAEPLVRTLAAVEKQFGDIIPKMRYVNFGGGHHITRDDYNIELLVKTIVDFRNRYGVEVYLEPGEAVVLNTGFLAATVLDVVHNDIDIAILDTSAACHMPDVIEMPYRPNVVGSEEAGVKKHTYRLAGLTCLAGDVIGDYSFDEPLSYGDKLLFTDMALYSMVKTNTFNGIKLPDICVYDPSRKEISVVKKFGYADFKGRLS
jgi:carboxynorspermidine decarboxylase